MRDTLLLRVALGTLVVPLLACGAPLAPSTVAGHWSAVYELPGAKLDLTLSETGTTVTGTGAYVIEAGRSGTLGVSGTYRPPAVTLELTLDYGQVEIFAGRATDGHMTGTLKLQGDTTRPTSVTFRRP